MSSAMDIYNFLSNVWFAHEKCEAFLKWFYFVLRNTWGREIRLNEVLRFFVYKCKFSASYENDNFYISYSSVNLSVATQAFSFVFFFIKTVYLGSDGFYFYIFDGINLVIYSALSFFFMFLSKQSY